MSINRPRIAGKPAAERAGIPDQPFIPHGTDPFTTGKQNVDGLITFFPPPAPEWEGQLYFHVYKDESNNRGTQVYVSVDIAGTLTWKPVLIAEVIYGYTGKKIDPIYDR